MNAPLSSPRIAFVYAQDDRVLGGGADARIEALRDGLRSSGALDNLVIPLTERRAHGARRQGERVLAALQGTPPRATQQLDLAQRARLRNHLESADVIVAATTFSLPYVPRCLWHKTVLDAHNIESRVTAQLIEHAPTAARRLAYRLTAQWMERWEKQVARGVAQVWAVSADEAAWFRRAGARRVTLIPNGVTLPAARKQVGRDVVMVASFGSVFNRQAAQWVIDEVWPSVSKSDADVRLVFAGRGSEVLSGPRVEALGYVDDLASVYARARVALAPLRSGAGTRLKVLEGLAHGVPVVSTRLGAEGLELTPGKDYLQFDDAEGFARAVLTLLHDSKLHDELADRGAATVRRDYDWAGIARRAAATLSGG